MITASYESDNELHACSMVSGERWKVDNAREKKT